MIETINKLVRTQRQLVQELGHEPTSEEIASRMDTSVDKVRKTKKIAQQPISLETPIGEDEDGRLGDFLEDTTAVSPSDAEINLSLMEQTSSVLKTGHRPRPASMPTSVTRPRSAHVTMSPKTKTKTRPRAASGVQADKRDAAARRAHHRRRRRGSVRRTGRRV